jgi:hypothetical protein
MGAWMEWGDVAWEGAGGARMPARTGWLGHGERSGLRAGESALAKVGWEGEAYGDKLCQEPIADRSVLTRSTRLPVHP